MLESKFWLLPGHSTITLAPVEQLGCTDAAGFKIALAD